MDRKKAEADYQEEVKKLRQHIEELRYALRIYHSHLLQNDGVLIDEEIMLLGQGILTEKKIDRSQY